MAQDRNNITTRRRRSETTSNNNMANSSGGSSRGVLAFGIAPFLVGVLLKLYVIPEEIFQAHVEPLLPRFLTSSASVAISSVGSSDDSPTANEHVEGPPVVSPKCHKRFQSMLDKPIDDSYWNDMNLFLHRNGDATSCGGVASGNNGNTDESLFIQVLEESYATTYPDCPSTLNKFQVESLLTVTLQKLIDSCPSVESDGNKQAGLFGFCDMGPTKTPILLDHDNLVPVFDSKGTESLPCRFHTREGLRISNLNQLSNILPPPCAQQGEGNNNNEQQTCSAELMKEVHLYVVPAGRVFMFAPSYVGEIFDLPHVEGSEDQSISMEVLSLNPRVFDVYNFFSREESQQIVDGAMAESRESHRIKRSTTGASAHSINSRRTSESGFDTHGATSVKVKKRCFAALGFDEYIESHGDGLQILRYNLTTAYNTHLDYFEDKV